MKINIREHRSSLIYWLPLLPMLIIFWTALDPIDGQIGHDYFHQFYRFTLGYHHFLRNFLDVPYYLAYLCGGVPYFADPQSAYYSLPQLMTFFFDLLDATKISYMICWILGYFGFIKLATEIFKSEKWIAHVGALLFVTNGFAFGNLFVGHITHHPYALLPWFVYFLFRPNGRSFVRDLAWLSLLMIYCFWSGSTHIIIVFGGTAAILAPYLIYFHFQNKMLKEWIVFLATTLVVIALGCLAKLLAFVKYSPLFIQRGLDVSNEDAWTLLTRYFWFDPSSTKPLMPWGEYSFGAWEFVGFLSKLTIPLLIAAPFLLGKRKRSFWIMCALSILVGFEFCLLGIGKGLNEYLPFFRHYHNPIKLLAGALPCLIFVSMFSLEKIAEKVKIKKWPKPAVQSVFVLLAAIILIDYFMSVRFYTENKVGIGFPNLSGVFQSVRANNGLPEMKFIYKDRNDWQALESRGASLGCYEPLFGYRLENMKHDLMPGEVSQIRDGAYNVNHPGCLAYPDHFGCKPWTRVAQNDDTNLTKFLRGETTAWGVPLWQSLLVYFDTSLILFLLFLGLFRHNRIEKFFETRVLGKLRNRF